MKTCRLYLLLALMLAPVLCSAQDIEPLLSIGATDTVPCVDFDAYVAELAAQCPIDLGDEWALKSVTATSDTAFVEIRVPGTIASFLPLLAEDSDNVRSMWLKEMTYHCSQWAPFVDKLAAARRAMVLTIVPKGNKAASVNIYYQPSDIIIK